jgi:hypothetical protein
MFMTHRTKTTPWIAWQACCREFHYYSLYATIAVVDRDKICTPIAVYTLNKFSDALKHPSGAMKDAD